MSFSNFLIEVLCLYLQIFLPPSNRFAAPPSSEWTRFLVTAGSRVWSGRKWRCLSTRDKGQHHQRCLWVSCTSSSDVPSRTLLCFSSLSIYVLSQIIKSSERLRLEGFLQDTILYSSRLSRVRKIKKTEKLLQTREDRGDVTTEGKDTWIEP